MVWKRPCFLLIYCLVSLSPPYFLFLFPVLSLAYCIILNQAHRFFWEQGAELTQNLLEHSEMCQPLEFLINFFRLRPTDLTTVSASVSKGERVRGKLIFSVVQTCPFLQRDTVSKVLMRADCVRLIYDTGLYPSGLMTDPPACSILAINRESIFFK